MLPSERQIEVTSSVLISVPSRGWLILLRAFVTAPFLIGPIFGGIPTGPGLSVFVAGTLTPPGMLIRVWRFRNATLSSRCRLRLRFRLSGFLRRWRWEHDIAVVQLNTVVVGLWGRLACISTRFNLLRSHITANRRRKISSNSHGQSSSNNGQSNFNRGNHLRPLGGSFVYKSCKTIFDVCLNLRLPTLANAHQHPPVRVDCCKRTHRGSDSGDRPASHTEPALPERSSRDS